MGHPEGLPQTPVVDTKKVVEQRNAQIVAFMAAMEGHDMNEELDRIFTKVEESAPDPDMPVVDASVFGPLAKDVTQLLQQYHAWSNRVYMTDVLNDDNRRQWRKAFQQHYGPAGDTRLERVLSMNKYKVGPVSGLSTLLESLCMKLECGSKVDRALAKRINAVWSGPAHREMFMQYYLLTDNEEKKRAMAQFGREFFQALDVIAAEARRRAERAA